MPGINREFIVLNFLLYFFVEIKCFCGFINLNGADLSIMNKE